MSHDRITRRRVLRGSAALGAAAMTGLSGCSAVTGLLGGGRSYTNWLHEPGEMADQDHYNFLSMEPAVLDEHEDEIGGDIGEYLSFLTGGWEPTDLDVDEMSQYISTSGSTVVSTDVAGEDVVDELESAGYDDEDEQGGYEIFLSEDERTAFGVSGDWIVRGQDGREDALDTVEITIDTGNGEEDRYVDEDEDFQTLVDALGDGTYVTGGTHEERESTAPDSGRFEGNVASGFRWQVDGEDSQLRYALVFDDADDVEGDDIEDWVDHGSEFDDLDDPEINLDGRTVVVDAAADTDDVWS